MHTFYRYTIEYVFEGQKRVRVHQSCLFLSEAECHMHMVQMIGTEMFCKKQEIRNYYIESLIDDLTKVPAMEIFGF